MQWQKANPSYKIKGPTLENWQYVFIKQLWYVLYVNKIASEYSNDKAINGWYKILNLKQLNDLHLSCNKPSKSIQKCKKSQETAIMSRRVSIAN